MPARSRPADGVRLAEVVAVMSLASDIGLGQPLEFSLRSTVLAMRFGESLGLGEPDLVVLYYYSLLRWVGCTADAATAAAVMGDELQVRGQLGTVDWGHPAEMMLAMLTHIGAGQPPLGRARQLLTGLPQLPRLMHSSTAHCEVAELLSERLGLAPPLLQALLFAFERWDGKGTPNRRKGEELPLPVRVGQLTSDATMFHRLGGAEAAVRMARKRSGGAHDPGLAERFCAQAPALLADLQDLPAWNTVLANEPGPRPRLGPEQVDRALRTVGDFVDLKSYYFTGHSGGVGDLAAAAAQRCRLPEAEVIAVRRAGYVHDLGRIAVSAAVWEKRGALSVDERERVRLHPYYTERLLAQSPALAPLGALAAQHHERLDGGGYHRGLDGSALSPAARVLAAADIYHALTQDRPHRVALGPDEAAAVLRRTVRDGAVGPEAADAVLAAAGHRTATVRTSRPADLTERELQVLKLLARGCTAPAIAEKLVISRKTAGHHIEHIYEKIGVSTRAAAALFAMQHNLLDTLGELADVAS